MPLITSRIPFTPQNPYRPIRPASDKIIFLSFEGSVTEEEYFDRITELFDEVKTRIQFISVAEDAVHTFHKKRTPEQVEMLSKSRPKQLVERIFQFKEEKEAIYQFSKYPNDEFWIVTDVDNNWSDEWIEEWNDAIRICEENGYGYAISNPFFEIWLLLHHLESTDEDKAYAVTETHSYEPTSHFRDRLREAGVPMKDRKHIVAEHYGKEGIYQAVNRAKELHVNKEDKCPKYFATTVYLLLEKIFQIIEQNKEI